MKLEIAVLSKAGDRSTNEDACGYWTSDAACCWVLSDGAGGHGGGDVASKQVVSTVLREFTVAPTVDPAALNALILRANDDLLKGQASERRLHDMRATVAVLTIDRMRGLASWAHLGDSRVYGFRAGRLRFQTRDHSVVQGMVDAGYGDMSLVRTHPQRSVLISALGSADEMQPSVVEAAERVRDGDVFMLCSDGFWEYVVEADMERLLGPSVSAETWLAALETELLARAQPGHDNYSAIAVWIGHPEDATQIMPSD